MMALQTQAWHERNVAAHLANGPARPTQLSHQSLLNDDLAMCKRRFRVLAPSDMTPASGALLGREPQGLLQTRQASTSKSTW